MGQPKADPFIIGLGWAENINPFNQKMLSPGHAFTKHVHSQPKLESDPIQPEAWV